MPELEFWFRGGALFIGASFCFATCVSIFAIREMISEKTFAVLMVSAVVLSGLAWRTAAKQEEDGAKRDAQNAALGASIGRIADNLKIDRGDQSALTLAAEILKHLPPKFPLTDAERERLAAVLSQVPQDQRFHIDIYWPQLNGTRRHASTFALVFSQAQWDVSVKMANLISGHGLTFAVSRNVEAKKAPMPMIAMRMMELFSKASVPYVVGGVDNAKDDEFAFVVGQPTPLPD